jgi:hypothetical protein
MRTKERQRVVCSSCGWNGGRAATRDPLEAPCSKCGAPVALVGAVYLEERVLAGCTGCGWWGERPPARVGAGCVKCPAPTTVPVMVVTLDGQVLPT